MADKMQIFLNHGDYTICQCGDCRRVTFAKNIIPLDEVKGLNDRLSEGSEVPAGECEACGALTYVLDFEEIKKWYVYSLGVRCPVCNSDNLMTPSGPKSTDDGYEQQVVCEKCESSWTDVYVLDSMKKLKANADPNKAKKTDEEE